MIAPEPDQPLRERPLRGEPQREARRHLADQNLALLLGEGAQIRLVAIPLEFAPLLTEGLQIRNQGGAILERRPVQGCRLVGRPDLGHQPSLGIAACTGKFAGNSSQAKTVNGDRGLNGHHLIFGKKRRQPGMAI